VQFAQTTKAKKRTVANTTKKHTGNAAKSQTGSAICGYYIDCGRGRGSFSRQSYKNKPGEESRMAKAF